MNSSSFTVTSDVLRLSPGGLIAFSFRTCSPGELLKQTGESLDQLQLRLDPQGRLLLSITAGEDHRLDLGVGQGLLDGQWHSVSVEVNPDGALVLSVTQHGNTQERVASASAQAADAAPVLGVLDLGGANPQLRVGAGSVACLREGPGVRFTRPGVAINSVAVRWDGCLLPQTCSGKSRKKGTETDIAENGSSMKENPIVLTRQLILDMK